MRARTSAHLSRDARLLIAGQGVRAAGYGFTAVLLGAVLAARGLTSLQVGAVLTALIAGTAVASVAVGLFADRSGRRGPGSSGCDPARPLASGSRAVLVALRGAGTGRHRWRPDCIRAIAFDG